MSDIFNNNILGNSFDEPRRHINNENYRYSMKSNNNIYSNDFNWADQIKSYEYSKKNLAWGYNRAPERITHKCIKSFENIFDPIRQKYKDPSLDKKIKEEERNKLRELLPKYYDNQLRNEQTFDIINLRDKLKGFENHPDYPKEMKKREKLNKEVSKVNYNILSNLTLDIHHYDKPENRPKIIKEDDKALKLKQQRLANTATYKDYDIISNKYLYNDAEKQKRDREINNLIAAKNFYNSREYDPIKGVYFNPDIEKQHLDDEAKKIEKSLNAKREHLFNPVNNEVYDKEGLKQYDDKIMKAKERYTVKPQIESYYHCQDLIREDIKDERLKMKLNYNRFKQSDLRGYDFINNYSTFNKYKSQVSCKDHLSPWEKITHSLNENETISKKGIFKPYYDKTDVEQNAYDFKLKRNALLKTLKDITKEESFKTEPIPRKIKGENVRRGKTVDIAYIKNNIKINKEEWFKGKKNVNMEDGNNNNCIN